MGEQPRQVALENSCPRCDAVGPQSWLFSQPGAIAWVSCPACGGTSIVREGVVEHPPELAGVAIPGEWVGSLKDRLSSLPWPLPESARDAWDRTPSPPQYRAAPVEEPDELSAPHAPGAPDAPGAPSGQPAAPHEVVTGSTDSLEAGEDKGGSMDQDVLNLALADQKEAEDKIADLRRQIEEEEQRIEQVAGFVETYRAYEARATQSTGSQSGSQSTESEPATAGSQPAESTSASSGGSYQPSNWSD